MSADRKRFAERLRKASYRLRNSSSMGADERNDLADMLDAVREAMGRMPTDTHAADAAIAGIKSMGDPE